MKGLLRVRERGGKKLVGETWTNRFEETRRNCRTPLLRVSFKRVEGELEGEVEAEREGEKKKEERKEAPAGSWWFLPRDKKDFPLIASHAIGRGGPIGPTAFPIVYRVFTPKVLQSTTKYEILQLVGDDTLYSPSMASRPVRPKPLDWATPSHITIFVRNLRLLQLDRHNDWPDITLRTLSPSSQNQRQRIRLFEWALYHLFTLWDPEYAQNVRNDTNLPVPGACGDLRLIDQL